MGLFSMFWLSENLVGLAAGKRGLPSRSSRAAQPAYAVGFGAAAFARFVDS